MKRIQFWTPTSLHILTKKQTKTWINHLNIRAKGRELLEENIGVNLSDFSFGNWFLDGYQKHKQKKTKEKNREIRFHRTEKHLSI